MSPSLPPPPCNNDPSGPSGLALRNRTLFVAIGAGDESIAGPLPGSESRNPNKSSPILSSVLAVDLGRDIADTAGDFLLAPGDHAALAGGRSVTLASPHGESASIRLVIDVPDYVDAPRPGAPDNIRSEIGHGRLVAVTVPR